MMTGVSQSLVSRAMRRIRGEGELLRVGERDAPARTLRICAVVVEFPRIIVEFSDGGADETGEFQAFDRRATAFMAALRVSGADAWPTVQQVPGAEVVEDVDGAGADEIGRAGEVGGAGRAGGVDRADGARSEICGDLDADMVRVLWEPGRQSWDAFLAQVAGLLGACGRCVDTVPGDLLSTLSLRVGQGLHGVQWHRSGRPGAAVPGSVDGRLSDSKNHGPGVDRSGSHGGHGSHGRPGGHAPLPALQLTPRTGELSTAEQVAIALRREITDAGYRAGDRVTSVVLASHMGIAQAAVRAAMRRLVDDGLLVSRNGIFFLPLVTGSDIIDLYASRLQVGSVLLRACATRPRHRLLGAQTALRAVEAAAAQGDAMRVDQADLYFQQELAEASGLTQSARTFHSLTLRLQMFISVLQLNYGTAVARILADDRQIMRALLGGNAEMAVWTWRSKLDNAVRHMTAASVGESTASASVRPTSAARFDVRLWELLTGG